MSRPRKYNVDDFAFSKRSSEMDYWVGFLMADGNIHQRKPTQQPILKIGLHEKDREHLEKLKTFLQADVPLFSYRNTSNTPVCELRVPSQQIAEDLQRYGVVSQKSILAEVRELENSPDFWRGVIDGDGWIGVTPQRGCELVGSEKLLQQFADYAHQLCPRNLDPLKVVPHKSIYRVRLRVSYIPTVLETLYYEGSVSLKRKYERAQEVLYFYSSRHIKTS